jgi:N-acetylglucosaminyldiphosphoundecaprenol N-acetyl-beta-D-mannosaminyltransferase
MVTKSKKTRELEPAMVNKGKFSVLGINIHAVNYAYAVEKITEAAESRRAYAVSALAVHGVMTGVLDSTHARRLNGLDLVVPDGQPVRWALDWLHGQRLHDRVYGPNLTLRLLKSCEDRGLTVYLYGSKQEVIGNLIKNLNVRFPNLRIAGYEPSKFRRLSPQEQAELVTRVKNTSAHILILGLGCPRQEIWAYEYRNLLEMPILAVGAAFDFFAGNLPQAPKIMQDTGLEWLFRLIQEPKRLWYRYMVLNPLYLWNIFQQRSGLKDFKPRMPDGGEKVESFG